MTCRSRDMLESNVIPTFLAFVCIGGRGIGGGKLHHDVSVVMFGLLSGNQNRVSLRKLTVSHDKRWSRKLIVLLNAFIKVRPDLPCAQGRLNGPSDQGLNPTAIDLWLTALPVRPENGCDDTHYNQCWK